MLSDARGSYSLSAGLQGDGLWNAAASLAQGHELSEGSLVLKLANYDPHRRHVNVTFAEWAPRIAVPTKAVVLTSASPEAENTLEEPNLLLPSEAPMPAILPTGLMVDVPPFSLVVVHIDMAVYEG